MKVQKLSLTNVRAFRQAELDFKPGMNLLVGVNGVGKTTIIDAIRICLSRILPKVTDSPSRPIPFEKEDITGDLPSLTATLSLQIGEEEFQYTRHQPRETVVIEDIERTAAEARKLSEQRLKRGRLRKHTRDLMETKELRDPDIYIPDVAQLKSAVDGLQFKPLSLFFSTRRSLVSDAIASVASAAGGPAGAFADALTSRELRLADMALWMRAQGALGKEFPLASKHIAALQRAVSEFLPDCKQLHAVKDPKPRLLLKKNGYTLDARQLSDGERGTLALVLDLARRLSQANPKVTDPAKQAEAIVLIDELDLHLHPKWQRTIVEQLTRTFPRCQFIATTHSPQIVSSVEAEHILLITDKGIKPANSSLGMDSNWILRHLMGTTDRPQEVAKELKAIDDLIKKKKYIDAIAKITAIEARYGGFAQLDERRAIIEQIELLSR